jgi:hypothetical protein
MGGGPEEKAGREHSETFDHGDSRPLERLHSSYGMNERCDVVAGGGPLVVPVDGGMAQPA